MRKYLKLLFFAFYLPLIFAVQLGNATPIKDSWTEIQAAIKQHDLRRSADLIVVLIDQRNKAGFDNLENYSLELLAMASERLKVSDYDEASFLTRKAIELSPQSASVIFSSLHLVETTGAVSSEYGSVWKQVKAGFLALSKNRELLSKIVVSAIYPALWAITFALFIAMALTLSLKMPGILSHTAKILPHKIRGFIAPILIAGLVLFPCPWGPLWCIAVWALVVTIALPEKRLLVFCSATVFALWSSLIPIREQLSLRLAEPGVSTILRASGADFGIEDRYAVEKYLQAHPSDSIGWLVFAQMLRHSEDFIGASQAFDRGEASMPQGLQAWLKSQRGMLAYLQGDSKKAETLMSEAENLGAGGAAFLFNMSKVKFDLSDTASSKSYLKAAEKKDASLVSDLQAREEFWGLRHTHSVANQPLPMKVVLGVLGVTHALAAERADAKAAEVVSGGSVILLMKLTALCGLLSFFGFLGKREIYRQLFYTRASEDGLLKFLCQIIPGGAWLLLNRTGFSVIVMSIIIMCVMPVLQWPQETIKWLHYFPDFKPFYISLVGLISLFFCYVGYFLVQDREEN